MEKVNQTEIRCRYLHQTDFANRNPRSQKTRNSKGFCEDNLPAQMSEQNSQGRDVTGLASNSDTRPRQSSNQTYSSNKKEDAAHNRRHPLINYLDLYLSISSRILNSCS